MHTKPTPVSSLSSIETAATKCDVSTKTIRRWIAEGRLTAYRMGPRLIRIDARELDTMLTVIPTVGGAA